MKDRCAVALEQGRTGHREAHCTRAADLDTETVRTADGRTQATFLQKTFIVGMRGKLDVAVETIRTTPEARICVEPDWHLT